MPLRGAANVSVRDAQTLLVTAFDPSVSSVLQASFADVAPTGVTAEHCSTADGACY